MKLFSGSDGYESDMSFREEKELKSRLAHLEKHGRIQDLIEIIELKDRKCKSCAHFERGVWAKELTRGPVEPQCGGHCEVLMQALKLDGNIDFAKEKIYIQDTFMCGFYQAKDQGEWVRGECIPLT